MKGTARGSFRGWFVSLCSRCHLLLPLPAGAFSWSCVDVQAEETAQAEAAAAGGALAQSPPCLAADGSALLADGGGIDAALAAAGSLLIPAFTPPRARWRR